MLNRNYRPLMDCCNCHAQIKKTMINPEGFPRPALRSFKVFQMAAHKNYTHKPVTEYTKVKIIRGRQLHHTADFVPNQN